MLNTDMTKGPKKSRDKVTAPKGHPLPPEDLDEMGRLAWRSVCDDLDAQGTLTKTDAKLIELYSREYSLFRKIEAQLEQDPLYSVADNGRMFVHPLLGQRSTVTGRLNKILNDLRLSPLTRDKATSNGEGEGFDKWKDLV